MTDDAKMPFLAHLAELRTRLLWCAVALLIGTGVGWNLSERFLAFIEGPLTGRTYLSALKETVHEAARRRFPRLYERVKPAPAPGDPAPADRRLNYGAPLEPFFVQVKLSMVIGAVLALPLLLYQTWLFVAPGLTRKERRLVVPFITAGTLSFCLGAVFFLVVIWPVIINFSLSYEGPGLRSWFNLSAYVNFCLRLILIFGLVFELPVVSLILARLGILEARFLARHRRFAFLASAIVAAFHADLITMAVVWIPLYLMYEASIWVVRLLGRRGPTGSPAPA